MPFTKTQYLFLELLKYGLWRTPLPTQDFENLSAKEWRRIYKLSAQQTCVGVIADAILSLPQNALPPMDFVGELMLRIKQVEEGNAVMNKELSALCEIYRKESLPFVLLKGQSLGCCYPLPALRMFGDIDVFFYRKGDYARANDWAEKAGYTIQHKALYETLFYFGDVAVEHHLYISYFGRQKYDKALQEILQSIVERSDFPTVRIGDTEVAVLPPTLNAVYVFQHILHHFSYLGIGLRQYADWLLFLSRHHKEIDKEEFLRYARKLDLLRPMQHFAMAAIQHLGASRDIFPFPLSESRYADIIILDCLQQGNFGFNEFEGRKFSSGFARKIFFYKRMMARIWRIGGISPEHISSKSWVSLLNQIKLLFIR